MSVRWWLCTYVHWCVKDNTFSDSPWDYTMWSMYQGRAKEFLFLIWGCWESQLVSHLLCSIEAFDSLLAHTASHWDQKKLPSTLKFSLSHCTENMPTTAGRSIIRKLKCVANTKLCNIFLFQGLMESKFMVCLLLSSHWSDFPLVGWFSLVGDKNIAKIYLAWCGAFTDGGGMWHWFLQWQRGCWMFSLWLYEHPQHPTHLFRSSLP